MTFLDTLLRDTAEGEHFSPLEPPAFAEAPAVVPVASPAGMPSLGMSELLQSGIGNLPRHGVNLLTALLHKPRPEHDDDRFTTGLGIVPSVGDESDPFPILF